MGQGFRVWGWGLGFRVQGVGFGVGVEGLGFRVWGCGFRVEDTIQNAAPGHKLEFKGPSILIEGSFLLMKVFPATKRYCAWQWIHVLTCGVSPGKESHN